jgi:hypothetical protein
VPRPVVQATAGVRVVKRATCPSVSGKSNLSYEIGVAEDTKALQLRVVANSGPGCFNDSWLKVEAIQACLDKQPKGETVTSHVLAPLVRGTSGNMAGFVWAVLLHVGLIVRSAKQPRRYLRAEPSAFTREIEGLVGGTKPVDVKPRKGKAVTEPQPTSPSAATKKKK